MCETLLFYAKVYAIMKKTERRKIMGSIRSRSLADGTIRYRAEIRINCKDHPEFKESKTFSSRRIAENWLYKREKELNKNPELLVGKNSSHNLTIGQAIEKYLVEVDGVYSKSKVNTLKLLQKLPIAKRAINLLKPLDISNHVNLRKEGYLKLELRSVSPSTIQNELLQIRSVLAHASKVIHRLHEILAELDTQIHQCVDDKR